MSFASTTGLDDDIRKLSLRSAQAFTPESKSGGDVQAEISRRVRHGQHITTRNVVLTFLSQWQRSWPNLDFMNEETLSENCHFRVPASSEARIGIADVKEYFQTKYVPMYRLIVFYPTSWMAVDENTVAFRRTEVRVSVSGNVTANDGILFVRLDYNDRVSQWVDYYLPAGSRPDIADVTRIRRAQSSLIDMKDTPARQLVESILMHFYDTEDFGNFLTEHVKFSFPSTQCVEGKRQALQVLEEIRNEVESLIPLLDSEVYFDGEHIAFEVTLLIETKKKNRFLIRGCVFMEVEFGEKVRNWMHVFDYNYFRAEMDRPGPTAT